MTTVNGSDPSKRSFEFRMCKKVAELTQVVHLLFTRNHEKEVELEALKESYEMEISNVIADARSQIDDLQRKQDDAIRQNTGDTESLRRLLQGEFESQEQEWQKKLEESEKLLQEERTECQNLRDLLIRAQRDIENIRHSLSQQVTSQAVEMEKRDQETERLKKHIVHLEQLLKDSGKEKGDLGKELKRKNDNWEREVRQLQMMLEESHRSREQQVTRNKQLEEEVRTLKRELNRKMAEVVNYRKVHNESSAASQKSPHSEELERLRRDVHRYRLELSNRDVIFNRMFTDKQPIHLDRSHGTACTARMQAGSQSAGVIPHPANGTLNSARPLKREKTLSYLSSFESAISFEEQPSQVSSKQQIQMPLSTPSPPGLLTSNNNHFPVIHCSTAAENRCQTPSTSEKLAKPRPLPKDLLFG